MTFSMLQTISIGDVLRRKGEENKAIVMGMNHLITDFSQIVTRIEVKTVNGMYFIESWEFDEWELTEYSSMR